MIHHPTALAYLVSAYPAASHTFILREVLGLRARGWRVATVSVNADRRDPQQLDLLEQQEQFNTLVLKNWSRWIMLFDLLQVLWRFGFWVVVSSLSLAWQLARPGWRGHALAVAYWLEAMLLARWMHQQAITHLHVHFANEASLVGLLCKRISACSLSYTIHGPDEFHDAAGQQLAAKVVAADWIVCISQFARSQLMQFSAPELWSKIQVVRLGINADYAPPRKIPSSVFTILCVGRLTPAKGQMVLLKALDILRNEGQSFRLVLCGAGPCEAQIRQQVNQLNLGGQVELTGALSKEAVCALYGQADLFVLPSFNEGIPVVLMEAMAAGVPCISTRIAGIPELIEHKVNGYLVAPGDEYALSDAIRTLANDAGLCERLKQQAQMTVAKDFCLEKNLGQLAQCFAEHCGGHHA
ncbi:glycosyltransferase family 4 protein [Deefgea tanakiae]|uniref:Glycosyltransferase family 4 protein n=1 Tax=Deefgea tanakiae TaxID=2865840 RepID=A0ABX8Z8M4_9NEIS|nr:glycosyltransferase family 4 protein [Deefgea tanakiae]QZA78931.1 glycosyltransferase family 4 protein [Deefgea tanakiae]